MEPNEIENVVDVYEFQDAFGSYTMDGDVSGRDKMALQYAALPPNQVVELSEPSDLAAILSGCVGVVGDELVAKPGHPVGELIMHMGVSSDIAMRDMLENLRLLLTWAVAQPEMRPYLYIPA